MEHWKEITPEDERGMVVSLLQEIAELESTRDKLGRHTNVSAHFEMLMNKHAAVFMLYGVKKLPPKNAL